MPIGLVDQHDDACGWRPAVALDHAPVHDQGSRWLVWRAASLLDPPLPQAR